VIIAGRRFSTDRARNLLQSFGTILGKVDGSHERVSGTGLGANTATPTDANDGHVNLIHLRSPTQFLLHFLLAWTSSTFRSKSRVKWGPLAATPLER
jgi:hypothetical protein